MASPTILHRVVSYEKVKMSMPSIQHPDMQLQAFAHHRSSIMRHDSKHELVPKDVAHTIRIANREELIPENFSDESDSGDSKKPEESANSKSHDSKEGPGKFSPISRFNPQVM